MISTDNSPTIEPRRGDVVLHEAWRGVRDKILTVARQSSVPIDATIPSAMAIQRGTVVSVGFDTIETEFATVAKPESLRDNPDNYTIGQAIFAGAFPQRGTGVDGVAWIDLNTGAVR